jgi:hypothetical protein
VTDIENTEGNWRTIPRYKLRLIHLEGKIAAPGKLVWETLTNWEGLLTWFNAVPDPIYPLIASPLLPGETEQDLPRTRRCTFDTSRSTGVMPEEVNDPDFVLPEYVDETLIVADANSWFLAYNYSDHFHPGLTTMQVVEEAPDRSRLVVRYNTLEDEDAPKLVEAPQEEGTVGYAFHDKADYRALKVYCEREWASRSSQ